MSSSIIQSLLHKKRVADLNAVSDDIKLEIYILALREIRDRLVHRKPREMTHDSLVDYEDALQEVLYGFYILRHKKVGKDYQLDKYVIQYVQDAFMHIGYIVQVDKNEGRKHEFFQYIVLFTNAIFQICAYFADGNE